MEFLVTGEFQETKRSFIRYVVQKIHTWDNLDQETRDKRGLASPRKHLMFMEEELKLLNRSLTEDCFCSIISDLNT